MKVLVVEIYGRGGLTHYTYNLVTELARTGVEVTLLTATDYELAPALAANGSGVRLEALFYRDSARALRVFAPLRNPRLRRKVKILEYVLATPAVVRLYRRLRPDVVHLQGSNPILLVTLAALKRAGCRAIYTAHDVSPLANRGLSRLLDRHLYRLADHVVVHGEGDRKALVARYGIAPRKVSVIRHGNYLFFEKAGKTSREEARRILGLAPAAHVVLFFGFLSWYKGLDILIRAFHEVRGAIPGARLVIAGDALKLRPGELEELQGLARELGIAEAVTWRAGYIPMDEVPRYFRAADCVALPYRDVSQSGVLHLAGAFGRPVVATRVGAFPEMIEEGVTGLLIDPEDPPALARALIRLLSDRELRDAIGMAARRAAENSFGWSAVAEETGRLYESVLRERAA